MVIPLILMFTVFSIANTASLIVDIPISGVSLNVYQGGETKDSVIIDLSSDNNNGYLIYQIHPDNVPEKLRIVHFSYSYLNGTPAEGIIELQETNLTFEGKEIKAYRIVPKAIGTIKVTATAGNYTDSVLVEVYSSKATAIPEIYCRDGQGELVAFDEVKGGDVLYFHTLVHPDNVLDQTVQWESSNANIISIDQHTGKARVLSSGEVEITATLNDSHPANVSRSVSINVAPVASISGVTIEGVEHAQRTIPRLTNGKTLNLNIELNVAQILENYEFLRNPNGTIDYLVLRYDQSLVLNHNLSLLEITTTTRKFSLELTLAENITEQQFTLLIRPNINAPDRNPDLVSDWDWSSIVVQFVDPVDYQYALQGFVGIVKKGSVNNYFVDVNPDDDEHLTFHWTYDANYLTAQSISGSSIRLYARKAGTTAITVQVKYHTGNLEEIFWTQTLDLQIIDPYLSLSFGENAKTYGLADEFAFGSLKLVGNSYLSDEYDFRQSLKVYRGSELAELDLSRIGWESSDPEIATISGGVFRVSGNGLVTITAYDLESKLLADLLGDAEKIVKATFTVRAVTGCNVRNYAELLKASDDGKKIIVQKSIMLGDNYLQWNGADYEMTVDLKTVLANHTFLTTADWTYYQNNNLPQPKLYYLIEFKDDVYGNGYQLNAHYLTNQVLHDFQKAAFFGPSNLVSMGEFASVKAQDNVSFLIRTDGVIVDNIELAGCNDVTDLTALNHVGTTVEVMADDVYITNSYLKNGRTVLRVYGEYESHNYQTASLPVNSPYRDRPIHVHLISSVLSNAREFILKIGTNEHILGDITGFTGHDEAFRKASPLLPKSDGVSYYGSYNQPTNTANLQDEFFLNTYVKTFMNVRDCLFNNSGLFSIGIESNFSGPVLDGMNYLFNFSDDPYNWERIAGTGFAALLRLEGEIKLFDWKNITHIDSSCLIEVGSDETYRDLLNFDIRGILTNLYEVANNSELADELEDYQEVIGMFKEVVTPYGGVDQEGKQKFYVHGGIAFYGGGKNYSMVVINTENTATLSTYSISIPLMFEIMSTANYENAKLYKHLPYAAGRENFNFLMYNSLSAFGPDEQLTAPKTVRRCPIDSLPR
jgi:hypothetical protein